MKLTVTTMKGETQELEALEGWRAMEVIRDYGLPIKAECGGCCACGTCHVYVDEADLGRLQPKSDEEQDMMDDNLGPAQKPNSRLSCQIIMNDDLDGLHVTLAPGSEP